MRMAEHFPDEKSCLAFAQSFGLVLNAETEVAHLKGDSCKVVAVKNKLGISFICRNKKPFKKERCLEERIVFSHYFSADKHLL